MTDDRRNPIRPFEPERIRAFLKGREVRSVDRLADGKSNTNYKLLLDDGTACVLRLYGSADPARECHILALAADLVPVPRVLECGPDYALLEFMPGRPLHEVPECAFEAARCLARIGSLRFPAPGWIQPDGAVTPWDFEGGDFAEHMFRDERVRSWLGYERIAQLRAILAREAPILAEIGAECSLVHGDYNPGNILIDGGRVSAVLDWEFAHAGTPWMDVGNLLRNLDACWHDAIRDGLMAGGMALPADWRKRADLVDLSSALEFLTTDRSDAFKRTRVAWVEGFVGRWG